MNNIASIAFFAISAIGVYISQAMDSYTNKKKNVLPTSRNDECIQKQTVRRIPPAVIINV
jgi:hypothetical protein